MLWRCGLRSSFSPACGPGLGLHWLRLNGKPVLESTYLRFAPTG
jgi:hypothetical protein